MKPLGSLESHECSYHRPLLGIAIYDGGNVFILVDMADRNPADPTVYHHDHDEFDEPEALSYGISLSDFLAQLKSE